MEGFDGICGAALLSWGAWPVCFSMKESTSACVDATAVAGTCKFCMD
jgi:hypothetical protein